MTVAQIEELVNTRVERIENLAKIFEQIDPASILHSRDIIKEMHDPTEQTTLSYIVADSLLYTVESGQVRLTIGDFNTNLIFSNIDKAADQLKASNYFVANPEDVETVRQARGHRKAFMSRLMDLRGNNPDDPYSIAFPTAYYIDCPVPQKLLALQIYGRDDDLQRNMKMLFRSGYTNTGSSFLHPGEVVQMLSDQPAGSGISVLATLNIDGAPLFNASGVKKDPDCVYSLRAKKAA